MFYVFMLCYIYEFFQDYSEHSKRVVFSDKKITFLATLRELYSKVFP